VTGDGGTYLVGHKACGAAAAAAGASAGGGGGGGSSGCAVPARAGHSLCRAGHYRPGYSSLLQQDMVVRWMSWEHAWLLAGRA
jgi:hypothetical protein